MKGILLAGGNGTRLAPVTFGTSKQLLPVYNKPLIYYPLSTLMLTGIRDILVISTPRDLPNIRALLGDGSAWGIKLSYAEQEKPKGIAQAFQIAEPILGKVPTCLILGDNIYHSQDLVKHLQESASTSDGATVFCSQVAHPEAFGIATFDQNDNVIAIEEKPKNSKSHWAITGLYFYDSNVYDYVNQIKPSPRGELEITDLNKVYLDKKTLRVQRLSRGTMWMDAGTFDNLLAASNFVQTIEHRQGLRIACLEEIAYRMGYIKKSQLLLMAEKVKNTELGQYLFSISEEEQERTMQGLLNVA